MNSQTTHFEMTDAQAMMAVPGLSLPTEVSIAIDTAMKLASSGGSNMTVVRTEKNGICILNDFQLIVEKNNVTQFIYSTDNGYFMSSAA